MFGVWVAFVTSLTQVLASSLVFAPLRLVLTVVCPVLTIVFPYHAWSHNFDEQDASSVIEACIQQNQAHDEDDAWSTNAETPWVSLTQEITRPSLSHAYIRRPARETMQQLPLLQPFGPSETSTWYSRLP